LWTALEVFDELIQLHSALATVERTRPKEAVTADLKRRLLVAKRHRAVLRQLIEEDGPAPLSKRRKS
jgi:hypothetical protein